MTLLNKLKLAIKQNRKKGAKRLAAKLLAKQGVSNITDEVVKTVIDKNRIIDPVEVLESSMEDKLKSSVDKFNSSINELESSIDYEHSILTGNLIKDSFVRVLDDGKPTGVYTRGETTVEAVHPFTKGFEGPYKHSKPDSAVDNTEDATGDNPYYYRRYYMGPRIARGGLSEGWGSAHGGHILKITKPAQDDAPGGFISLGFVMNKYALVHQVRFRGYIKIVKGTRVGFGTDAGYKGRVRGHQVYKVDTDKAPEGWAKLDFVVGVSNCTNQGNSNFLLGFDYADDYEVYLALPSLSIIPSSSYRLQTVQEV